MDGIHLEDSNMSDHETRELIKKMLTEPNAHLTFQDIISGFTEAMRGIRPEGFSHTAWQLLEHLRLSQLDILDFSRNPNYQEMNWPDDYWPDQDAPADSRDWGKSVQQFESDLAEFVELIDDESNDLLRPFPHGQGQNLLREAMLLSKHNSYHLGQLMTLRKLLERRTK
jgi:hypothetical protein